MWSLHGHSSRSPPRCWSALSWAYLIQASLAVHYHTTASYTVVAVRSLLLLVTDEALSQLCNFRKSVATPIRDLFTLPDFNRTGIAERFFRLMLLSLYNFVYISSSITALYTACCHRLRTAKSQTKQNYKKKLI